MKNKGYILIGPGQFQHIEKDLIHTPPKGYVLLQVNYCGVCGGDHSCYLGRRKEYPKSLGHEFVGTVITTGKEVYTLKPGDFVISDLNYRCGKCVYCTNGKSHLCLHNNDEHFSNRAFFQYMLIDESYLYPVQIKPSLLYRAALIEPLSCTIHAHSQFGDHQEKILINGCGSIGTLLSFYLTRGPTDCRCNIFLYDTNTHRKQALAHLLGTRYIDHPIAESFDSVYECTNSVAGMKNALKSVKQGGSFCCISHLYGEETSFIYEGICKKELRPVFPLRNGNPANLLAAIRAIETCWDADLDQLIGIYPFHKLPDVFSGKEQLTSNKQIICVRLPN